MMSAKKLGVNLWSRACRLMEGLESIPEGTPDLFAKWKIALVKQVNYTDLYTNPNAQTIHELLESSTMRTGPTGFWPDGKPSFYIVHDQPDPESRIWEWRLASERQNPENFRSREKVRAKQREVAVDPDQVDWGQFDLVVTIENAVPARITGQFPNTKWATFIEHHRMPQYRKYLRKPPIGYDFFFTQRYGPNPQNLWQGKHAVDVSYGFKRVRDVSKLFPNLEKKAIVHVEDHQDLNAIRKDAEKHGIDPATFRSAHGTNCLEYLRSLAESRVFFAPNSSRPLGGLAVLDAVAAGCVAIANPQDLWNSPLVSDLNEFGVDALLEFLSGRERGVGRNMLAKQQRRLARFQQYRVAMQLSESAALS